MDVYYMYTETDSRTVFFVFCIRIVNITRRSTLYIARSPGYILNIRDGFHPVARIYANIIVVFPRTIQFCDVILCCIATRRGAEVVEFSRGMNVFWRNGGGWCKRLHGAACTRIRGLSARGIRFPLIKNGGESHYILVLYYYIIVIYIYRIYGLRWGNRISGIRTLRDASHQQRG